MNKVFILKSWSYFETHPYPANIFPTIVGVYNSLLLAENEIQQRTKGAITIYSSSELLRTKFYIVEEHHFSESIYVRDHGFDSAPFQTWTYLSDGQRSHQSQRIDQPYIPQKKQFNVGDSVEIVDVFRNLLVAGVVFQAPSTEKYLEECRQRYKQDIAQNTGGTWEIFPIEPFLVGMHNLYRVSTMQGNVANYPGYVFAISKHFSDEDRIFLKNLISARKKLCDYTQGLSSYKHVGLN